MKSNLTCAKSVNTIKLVRVSDLHEVLIVPKSFSFLSVKPGLPVDLSKFVSFLFVKLLVLKLSKLVFFKLLVILSHTLILFLPYVSLFCSSNSNFIIVSLQASDSKEGY